MSHFEHDLYENELPPAEWQKQVVGVRRASSRASTPPGGRDPTSSATPAPRPTSTTTPPQYYDYALATLIKFQLHDHICTKILKQDVRACDYSGNKEVGDFLQAASCRWARRATGATVIKDATGEPISPRAMMAFYAPLVAELAKRNAGKDCGR